MKIAVAGVGYVGIAQAVLLAQRHSVKAITTTPAKAEKINSGISPIVDKEIFEYMKKNIDLTATTDAESAYREAEVVIVANRMEPALEDVQEKIYTRDLYFRD